MSTKCHRFAPGYYSLLFSVYSDDCFKSKYKPESKTPVVNGRYEVERVNGSAGKAQNTLSNGKATALLKTPWSQKSTRHPDLFEAFQNPSINPEHVDECRERLALLLEKGLNSPNSTYEKTLVIKLDVVRYLFPKSSLHLDTKSITEAELVEAGLPSFVKKCLTFTGGGCSVITPLKMKMFLGKSTVLKKDGSRKLDSRPIKKFSDIP